MDIYTILSSKPHNPHYLNRYITFIANCQLKNTGYEGYAEKHHICPKADDMFPEYSSFGDYPWNCAILTARQHFIAHVMLWLCYRNKSSANTIICFMRNNCKNSKLYSQARIEYSKQVSKRMKKLNKNKIIAKDKHDNCFMIEKDDQRFLNGELVGVMKGVKGYKWTESQKEKIRGENNIGFRGKKHSEETKLKISESLSGGKTANWKVVTCTHCGKSGKGPNMTRYHFNNCKNFMP